MLSVVGLRASMARFYCETFSCVGNLTVAALHLGNGRARSMRKGWFEALKTGLKFGDKEPFMADVKLVVIYPRPRDVEARTTGCCKTWRQDQDRSDQGPGFAPRCSSFLPHCR